MSILSRVGQISPNDPAYPKYHEDVINFSKGNFRSHVLYKFDPYHSYNILIEHFRETLERKSKDEYNEEIKQCDYLTREEKLLLIEYNEKT